MALSLRALGRYRSRLLMLKMFGPMTSDLAVARKVMFTCRPSISWP